VARDLRLDADAFRAGEKMDPRRTEALLGFVFDQSRVEIARGLEDGRIDFSLRAPEPGALMAYRNVLKLSPEQAQRLYARLFDFWMEYEEIAKHPADDGRFYAFTVALYPNDVAPPTEPAKPLSRRTRPRSSQP
jgi:hypothetical protein